MARKRMIDPGFWTDEKLGTCSPMARLTFMGVISQADDDGRLNGHPALIRSLLFPYDHDITVDQVEGWLAQLEERRLIIRYQVDGQSYIAVTNFAKHQTINKKTASKLPPPPENLEESSDSESLPEDYGSTTVALPPKRKEEKRKEEKRREEEAEKEKKAAAASARESFYAAHKRVFGFECNPHQAEKLAAYIDHDGVDEAVVIRAIERAAERGTGYRFGLIQKILNDYIASGVKTLSEAIALDNEFQKREALKRDPPRKSVRAVGSEYDGLSL